MNYRIVIAALAVVSLAGPARGWTTNSWQFLESIERANLRFFQEQKRGPYALLNDTAYYDSTANFPEYSSVAGIGFELTAICLGHYRGWISYSNAYLQVLQQLKAFDGQLSTNPAVFARDHGWTYHTYWIDGPSAGQRYEPVGELSLLDHSLFMAGVIFAGEYFAGTEAGEIAHRLYAETQWSWRSNNDYNFGYSEDLLAIVESAEAPEFKKGAEAYAMWDGFIIPPWPRTLQLYFWQYPHAWIDFRFRTDQRGNNHAAIALDSILYQRQRAIDLHNADPITYNMIGSNVWGWTAAGSSEGYRQMAPWGMWLNGEWYTEEHMSDSGSITPIGLPGCMVYAGTETLAALKEIFERFYVNGWNAGAGEKPVWSDVYGFINCMNTGAPWDGARSNWYARINAGIDYGPNVLLLENYKLGATWRYFMQNPSISAGMTTLGFGPTQHVWSATFAGATNQFGGGLGAWHNDATPVSATYENADFTNGFVGDQVVRFVADHDNEGGWIDLYGRDQRGRALVSFWARGLTGNEGIEVGLKDVFSVENKVRLADYTGGATPTNWTLVRIPIERFCLTGDVTHDVWPGGLILLSFAFTNATGGRLEVDAVAFTTDSLPPATPTNGFGVAQAGPYTRVTWDPTEAEHDVVGYYLHRRLDATSGFTRVTSTLLPSYLGGYMDTSIVAGVGEEVRYTIQAWDNADPQNSSPYAPEHIVHGGQLDVDWNNGRQPNALGGSADGYWGAPMAESFAFVFTNGPDGIPQWIRRSSVAAPASGHFIDTADVDVSGYADLGFFVRGAAGGEDARIGLRDCSNEEHTVALGDVLPGGVQTNWCRVAIPLSDFTNVNMTALRNISIGHVTPGVVDLAGLCFLPGQRASLGARHYTEAEHFTRQAGTTMRDFKDGASGGEVLGQGWGADGGDFADYEFRLERPLTTPTLRLRYACDAGDGRVLDVRWDDQPAGTLACTNTGGWGELTDHFQWASAVLSSAPTGSHTLTFATTGADEPVNLDAWYLDDAQSAFRECEAFTSQTGSLGPDFKQGASAGAVLGLSWGEAAGSEAVYDGVIAGSHSNAWLHLWYASHAATGRVLDVFLDNQLRARLACAPTHGWGEVRSDFDRASARLGAWTAGPHSLRFAVGDGGTAVNLDCFYVGDEPPDGAGADADHDGLGDRQEAALGTQAGNSDSDGDGISDSEELQFGSFGQVTSPTNRDTDQDGESDHEEFIAGTDPSQSTSFFAFAEADAQVQGRPQIRWRTASNRSYAVHASDDPTFDGDSFGSLAGTSDIVIDAGLGRYTDTSPPPYRVYRLGVSPTP